MIQFEDVVYRHPGTGTEIGPISFSCNRGERLLLAGLNGSGKSTVLRLAAGILKPTSGKILIDGIATDDDSGLLQKRSHIGYIFQNPESQLLTNSIDLELAFSLENLGIDRAEIVSQVETIASEFGFSQILERHPSTLSSGETQRLAIACNVITKPTLVLMDEPSSYLDAGGKELVDGHIFGDHSKTILAASHDLSELNSYDRILFLDDGRQSFLGSPKEFQATPIWNRIHSIANVAGGKTTSEADSKSPIAISIDRVSFSYDNRVPILSELCAEISSNRVTGIVGASGSGKTTLALMLAGILKPKAGVIKFDGGHSSSDAPGGQVGYVFQIPESAIFAETVFEELAFGLRNKGLTEEKLPQLVESAISLVGLDPNKFMQRNPMLLSSGEQRLVSIAAIVALERRIIILDEPTADLDWLGETRIQELIIRLKDLGKTVIVISHSEKFLACVADRIIELRSGLAIVRE